jgi:hypothetical protein
MLRIGLKRDPITPVSVWTNLWNGSDNTMKGILLWLVGIPIPIIILLYLLHIL